MVISTAVYIHAQHYQQPVSDVTTIGSALSARMGFTRLNKGTLIGNSGWMLDLDLGVDLEAGETFAVASNSWIDEYGHGDTESDAIGDLLSSLGEFRESLERQRDYNILSEELNNSLEKLRILLVRVDQ